MDYNSSPDYLKAADLHNVGSGSPSFFSDPIGAIESGIEGAADFVAKTPAFAVSSVVSGINSIYNSGVVAGNFFGLTDTKEVDTRQLLGSFDSDLGKYYEEHKQSADIVGFIGTSFVPGIAGTKLFNGGQRMLSGALKSGGVGRTLAEGTGLIPSLTAEGKTLTQVAGEALANGQQTFTLMNAGVIKAIGSGVAQATWESAAFETMVAATMFRSPVLEGQDVSDIASNILLGAAVGGAIGGALNSAKVYGDIKKVITSKDLETAPMRVRGSQFGLDKDPASRILVGANDLAATPQALDAAQETLKTQRITAIEQERREAIHQLAKGDVELGNFVADATHGMSPDQVVKTYQGAKQMMRPGYEITPTEGFQVGYVRLHGEGIGETTFDALPKSTLTLADKYLSRTEVDKFVKSNAFTEAKLWSPVTASSMDEIEARYIWAEKSAKYKNGMTFHEDDIPLLEGAIRNKLESVRLRDMNGLEYEVRAQDMSDILLKNKQLLAQELQTERLYGWSHGATADAEGFYNIGEASKITSEEIARVVNVSVKALEQEALDASTMYARQSAQAAYDEMRAAKKLSRSAETDLTYIPKHAAVVYDTASVAGANADTVSALVLLKQQQKIQREATDKAVAGVTGDLFERLVHPGDKLILSADRYGAGAGLGTFSNGKPGTLGSWAEWIGKTTSDLTLKLRKDTSTILDTAALRLRKNQHAAIEFDKLRNLVASTTEKYTLNEAQNGLVAVKTLEWRKAVKAGQKNVPEPILQPGAPDEVKFINADAGDAIVAHMKATGDRTQHGKNLKASVGLEDSKDPTHFYPHKPSPRDMPYFAFVKDESVVGAGMGHTSMLHAASEHELEAMIKMARERTGFTVYTKGDAENFYKAEQSYEFERTLHENYIDSSLKSKGINNQFFPKTDPDKIVDEWLKWHARGDDVLARETISTKFGHEFDQLTTLGQQYTDVAASRYAVNAKHIESTAENPYNDYRKTALNISRLGEYPLLSSFNRNLESAVSGVYQKIRNVWDEAKDVNDLEKVNAALQAAGVNHAYKNAAEIILANHSAPAPYVSRFIRGANAILANTFLRLDPLNALNNAIGAQVLLGHETSAQVKSALKDIAGIAVPGTQDSVLSTSKLIANANSNWLAMPKELGDIYKRNGWMTNLTDTYKSTLDDLTLSMVETPAQLDSKLSSALAKAKVLAEKGEKITGNKLAEEYNRFVAADVGRQIAEVRINAGLMTRDDSLAFINTFVNRTQGNMLASQRPLIFQGPIGQAVGLFQTFQFNTMQQLFRAVSEGGAKDAAMLLGLQGTMYGMNGLPAFQYINQHIVGTASGNKEHTDAYSTIYGAAGKTAGDWLMYGIPSNLLQTNIYSRGDINPRTLTIIPTNPADIVAVSAFGKFAGNMKETLSKIAGGGDVWQSVLQGLEHNTLSRPLAGLAQTLQASTSGGKVFSTTGAGDVGFVNDFMSLATISRLAGGKPLDEALANDEVSRSMVYKAADRERMKAATEKFKTTVIGDTDNTATPQAVNQYMAAFVRNGGRVEQFNQNMLHTMTQVNTPRANLIIQSLKGSYPEHMKTLMGGQLVEGLDSQ